MSGPCSLTDDKKKTELAGFHFFSLLVPAGQGAKGLYSINVNRDLNQHEPDSTPLQYGTPKVSNVIFGYIMCDGARGPVDSTKIVDLLVRMV